MVDIPLDKLLAIGEANLKKDYDKFVATAKKIDPTKTPAEVMKLLSDKHPTEEDLIPAGKRTIEKIRKFLIDKKIVTIPSEVRPTIMETPRMPGTAALLRWIHPEPMRPKRPKRFTTSLLRKKIGMPSGKRNICGFSTSPFLKS